MAKRYTQKGVAAVEFAILLPVLVLICFGITEYGRAMYQYDALTKSVRNAVRYMSQQAPNGTTAQGVARCLAVHGNRDCGGASLVPGLTTSMVLISNASSQPTGSGTVDLVTVTISGYQFDSLVPGIFSSITFHDISATMRQSL